MSVGVRKHGFDATKTCEYCAKEVKILYKREKVGCFFALLSAKFHFSLQNETKCGAFVVFGIVALGRDRMRFGKVQANLAFYLFIAIFAPISARRPRIFL